MQLEGITLKTKTNYNFQITGSKHINLPKYSNNTHMKEYIKNLNLPSYHKISFDGRYLKMSYQDLYLCGDIVFNKIDKVRVIDIKKFNLDDMDIKKIVDKFVENANERNRSKPNQIQILNDIDNMDYANIWDFNYSDEGLKDRWLNREGRCDY